MSGYSWAQFGCQHNSVLGSILGEEGVLPGRASPPPPLPWMRTSHSTPLLPLQLILQASLGGRPHSGLLWQLLSQGRAEGGPSTGRGRDKGPGWASRCSAGPTPLEDELRCPLAHVRLATSSVGGPSSKGS